MASIQRCNRSHEQCNRSHERRGEDAQEEAQEGRWCHNNASTKKELQATLKSLGLKQSENKDELLDRLRLFRAEENDPNRCDHVGSIKGIMQDNFIRFMQMEGWLERSQKVWRLQSQLILMETADPFQLVEVWLLGTLVLERCDGHKINHS